MLTDAQKTIVQEVCSIQFNSLNDILIKTELGEDDQGDRYEDILADMGFDRKDFDDELIKTILQFKGLNDDPEKVFELKELDAIVFKHILHNFRHRWEERFPKALSNLWNKLFIWTISNEIHNKN